MARGSGESQALMGSVLRGLRGGPKRSAQDYAPMPYQPRVVDIDNPHRFNLHSDPPQRFDEELLKGLMAEIDSPKARIGDVITYCHRAAQRGDTHAQTALKYLALREAQRALLVAEDRTRHALGYYLGQEAYAKRLRVSGQGAGQAQGVHTLHIAQGTDDDKEPVAMCGQALNEAIPALRGEWQSGRYMPCPGCANHAQGIEECAETPHEQPLTPDVRDTIEAEGAEALYQRLLALNHSLGWQRDPYDYEDLDDTFQQRMAVPAVARPYAERMIEVLRQDPENAYKQLRKRAKEQFREQRYDWEAMERAAGFEDEPHRVLDHLTPEMAYARHEMNVGRKGRGYVPAEDMLRAAFTAAAQARHGADPAQQETVAELSAKARAEAEADRLATREMFLAAARGEKVQIKKPAPPAPPREPRRKVRSADDLL